MQLKEYFVIRFDFTANTEHILTGSEEMEFDIDFNFLKTEERNDFRVDLTLKLNENVQPEKCRYRFFLVLHTFYAFEQNVTLKKMGQLITYNGLAMSYSIARSIIGDFTASSVHGKFILPAVNFVELLKQKAIEKKEKNH